MSKKSKKVSLGLLVGLIAIGGAAGGAVWTGSPISTIASLGDASQISSSTSNPPGEEGAETQNIFQTKEWTAGKDSEGADYSKVWTKKFTRESDQKKITFTIEAKNGTNKFRVGRYNGSVLHYVWTKDLTHPLEERDGTADALAKAETAIKESMKVVVRLRKKGNGFVVFKFGESEKSSSTKYFDTVKGNKEKSQNKQSNDEPIDNLLKDDTTSIWDNDELIKAVKTYAQTLHTKGEETEETTTRVRRSTTSLSVAGGEKAENIFQTGGWTKDASASAADTENNIWEKKFTRDSDSKKIEFMIEANKSTNKFRVIRYDNKVAQYVWTHDLDHPLTEREYTKDSFNKAEVAIKKSLNVRVRIRKDGNGHEVFKVGKREDTVKYFDYRKENKSEKKNKLCDDTAIDTLIGNYTKDTMYDNDKMIAAVKTYAKKLHDKDEETSGSETV